MAAIPCIRNAELMALRCFYYALYMGQFKGKAPSGSEAVEADFIST
jgi:hypothetical protein